MKEIKSKTVLDEETNQFYYEGKSEYTLHKDSNVAHYLDELSRPNLLINGDFQIWQRGETFTTTGYSVDRWKFSISAGNEPILVKNKNGLKITETTSSSNDNQLDYFLETADTMKLSKKTITLSISKVGSVKICLRIKNGSNYTLLDETLENALTVKLPEYVEGDMLNVCLLTYKNVEINWVKLELGSFVTSLISRTYGEELALCKRYYKKMFYDISSYNPHVEGSLANMTRHSVNFDIAMRVKPKVTILKASNISNVSAIKSIMVRDNMIALEFTNINANTFYAYNIPIILEAEID